MMRSVLVRARRGVAAATAVATALVTVVLATTLATSVAAPAAAAVPVAGGTYQLVAGHSGLCLDVPGASADNGTVLQQWGCTSGASWQQFRLTSVGSGRYQITNLGNGLCLDVTGGSTATGARVVQWGCSGAAWQQWTLTAGSGGAYRVANVNSGLCLTAQSASTASGAVIVQGACTTATDKQWLFNDGSSGGGGGTFTVAADGTGTYRTVQAAVDAVPTGNTSRVTITIKPGTYREHVIVPSTKPYVALVGGGDSPDDVVIVHNTSAGQAGSHRGSATLVAEGHDFFADNLTVSNDYDESVTPSQALAVYLNADRARLDDLRLLGDQDTFLVNNSARAYVTDSYIEGTVDFIYGGGIAVFDRCRIYEKRSTGGPITAASTPAENPYGFLFYRSTITGATNNTTQLGRPWRQGAQVVYRESSLSATIATAQPWTDMSDAQWELARYFEYRNTGAGATVNANRPQLTDAQAVNYTPQRYLAGSDGWNPVEATSAWSSTPDGFAATGGGTTGGAAGPTVTVTTFADLVRYATASTPYVIRVAGTVTVSPYGHEIPVTSDKTIVGVGTAGHIVGGGFFLGTGVHNVILRNLTIRDTRMADDDPDDKTYDYDGIQMDTADHIWIDHNRITRMNDGLIDSRKDTTYLTVSWNVLEEGNKSFGIGWTTNVTSRMTIHHNWIRATNQRNPSIDNVAYAHLYNNYLQDITSYGNLSRGTARTVIENSYYDHVNNPFYRDTTAASLTQTGSILASTTGRAETGGTTFRPADHYSYTLDPAAQVPAIVSVGAGPQASIG